MLLKKTDIEQRLALLKSKDGSSNDILDQVYQILETNDVAPVTSEPKNGSVTTVSNNFIFDELESHRVYHIEQIKQICIDYRLRFLDSKYFKGKIPKAAKAEILRLEELHHTELGGFKIMAPSKLFKLEDKDDPLLFAPIGNGYFYQIHKWGNDLHPLRKMLVWPFKNILNLTLPTLVISYFATLLVPNGLFSKNESSTEFWMMFFFMLKSIAAIVIFYGFALGKNFNPAIWNSKYYNA